MEEETCRRLSSASRNADGDRLSSNLGLCWRDGGDIGVSEGIWGKNEVQGEHSGHY